jgi:hypothetical protein
MLGVKKSAILLFIIDGIIKKLCLRRDNEAIIVVIPRFLMLFQMFFNQGKPYALTLQVFIVITMRLLRTNSAITFGLDN